MGDPYTLFAKGLVTALLEEAPQLAPDPDHPCRVRAPRPDGSFASLDLTPFQGLPQPVSALPYFQQVLTMDDLLDAYRQASKAMPLEGDLPGMTINPPARSFLEDLLGQAQATLADAHARRIARFVQNFDIYVAVKAVESLLNSRADLALLGIAQEQGWVVHFDHVAIRCGSAATQDAERVAQLLQTIHGYLPSQVPEEAAYQFPDGWNAYPLYKILSNGQVLRIFLDQSDAEAPAQIIQHWNRVYGFTAHHLALRASRQDSDERRAVSLETLTQALKKAGMASMEATGHYTAGLLLQVFVQPERHVKVSPKIKQELAAIDPDLERSIENGKLLELVSRREMPALLAKEYFALYGLTYERSDPLHSAPYYHYFLPAQAAHVIRTSVAG